MCKICTFHNVSKIFAEKFTPNNKTETLNFEKCLNENECKKYYKMIRIQQAIYYFNLLTNVKIDSSFSLKLFKQINVNSCSCMKDKNILTVNNFKNIYPCKDMSVIYGNFYEQ